MNEIKKRCQNKSSILSFSVFFALSFLMANPVFATDYYFSPSGSDSNNGTSPSTPWKTFSKVTNIVQPGDNIYLRSGTYTQAIRIAKSGQQGKPITISNYQNENPILDGKGLSDYSMVRLSGDWLVAQGLEIRNTSTNGAAMLVEGNHGTIKGNKIHDNWDAAIHINGDYGLAENNTVWNNGLINENNKSGTSGGWPAIVSCVRNYDNPTSEHCTLRKNVVYGNWGEGISMFEQIYATIEDNISYNNQQNIYVSDTKYSTIQRNISYCTPGNPVDNYHTQTGILVGDEKGVLINGTREKSSDNKILNNMVIGCDRNIAAGANESTNNLYAYNTFVNSDGDANVLFYTGSCSNCKFINNLIFQNDSVAISMGGATGMTLSNNLWSKAPTSLFKGSNDITASPSLANVVTPSAGNISSNNFKLSSNSPAIDKGKSLSEITTDFFGATRGSSPDIGAHEYGSAAPEPEPEPTPEPEPEPTPVPTPKLGDANNDNLVNEIDYNIWRSNYLSVNKSGASYGDFNNDGKVNSVDYVIWLNNYGK